MNQAYYSNNETFLNTKDNNEMNILHFCLYVGCDILRELAVHVLRRLGPGEPASQAPHGGGRPVLQVEDWKRTQLTYHC